MVDGRKDDLRRHGMNLSFVAGVYVVTAILLGDLAREAVTGHVELNAMTAAFAALAIDVILALYIRFDKQLSSYRIFAWKVMADFIIIVAIYYASSRLAALEGAAPSIIDFGLLVAALSAGVITFLYSVVLLLMMTRRDRT